MRTISRVNAETNESSQGDYCFYTPYRGGLTFDSCWLNEQHGISKANGDFSHILDRLGSGLETQGEQICTLLEMYPDSNTDVLQQEWTQECLLAGEPCTVTTREFSFPTDDGWPSGAGGSSMNITFHNQASIPRLATKLEKAWETENSHEYLAIAVEKMGGIDAIFERMPFGVYQPDTETYVPSLVETAKEREKAVLQAWMRTPEATLPELYELLHALPQKILKGTESNMIAMTQRGFRAAYDAVMRWIPQQ